MPAHPMLPEEVAVAEGVDLAALWDRFLPFEALHHLHDLCVPMASDDLDEVVELLHPGGGERALDVACGHGELSVRLAEHAAVDVLGVDLSPWALRRAAQRAAGRRLTGAVEWLLADGADLPAQPDRDIGAVLGASWIWHGFAGTARALARRVRPGGRVAIGDLRAREDATSATVGGRVDRRVDQVAALEAAGLDPTAEVEASSASWRAYRDLVVASADAHAAAHPDDPAADQRSVAAAWLRDVERDQANLVWSVWVARRRR